MQALLVLDVMNAIFELPIPLHDPDGFLARVGALLDRARVRRVPVVHFRQLGPAGGLFAPGGRGRELHPRVAPAPDELVIDKREPDMFVGTSLADALAARAVAEVVICGFATEGCIDTTVRSAWAKGLRVVLAAGAHTTTANAVLSAQQIVQHHELVLARFAQVVPAAEIAFM
ncbi:MAG: isochorismatase family protein [Deltaproteobacteria bacterium]|nr:isochorismatase family protein [Deltaproteobacteria bacterium]